MQLIIYCIYNGEVFFVMIFCKSVNFLIIDGSIKNRQSRDMGNHDDNPESENLRSNGEWTVQRHWQHVDGYMYNI